MASSVAFLWWFNSLRLFISSSVTSDDSLEFMLDQGDDSTKILSLAPGIPAKGLKWMTRARKETESIAENYSKDLTASIFDKLSNVLVNTWEAEFTVLDMCLKDSIRLQIPGNGFRRNISKAPLHIGSSKEIVTSGAFVAYHIGGAHHDSSIYPDPEKWDPACYLPERAEDKEVQHGYVGWGSGRHPCLGMRFAELETNVIIAHILSKFEFSVCNRKAEEMELPKMNPDDHAAQKPDPTFYLNLTGREA